MRLVPSTRHRLSNRDADRLEVLRSYLTLEFQMTLWPARYGKEKRRLKGPAFSICPEHNGILLIYKTLGVYGFSYGRENTMPPITVIPLTASPPVSAF